MKALSRVAEKALEAAAARGDLDEFDGKGQPLEPSQWGDPNEGQWAMAFHLLRQAEMAPRWIELDKEIRARRAKLRAWLWTRRSLVAEEADAEGQHRSIALGEIKAINQLVELRNQLAPSAVRPAFFLQFENELKAALESTSRPQEPA